MVCVISYALVPAAAEIAFIVTRDSGIKIIRASDSSLLVEFESVIDPALHQRVLNLFRAFLAKRDPRIRNLHPAYASLLIDFYPLQVGHEDLESQALALCEAEKIERDESPRVLIIPVCYDTEFGLDLADVAKHNSLTADEVIRLHTESDYLVYFLGFSPGFAYLGGLPPKLRTPRLTTPRTGVPAGSVGIAGDQTGVYPVDSPGGWRLIGRTPLRMFDPSATPPTRLQAGDQVRFASISRAEFERLAEKDRDFQCRS